ncbi:uncharacterized protein ARMOST_00582 [Armillaria ostoyae]|uniref:Retrotransposon gag domain-containing protein n=1 Tax=Armillaria ostoyae TaxID=47428 RepID=A0A284QLM6_ARMOS|nr:uncharacterized protein ARMOST_00582 [Armillaria ostoyae]
MSLNQSVPALEAQPHHPVPSPSPTGRQPTPSTSMDLILSGTNSRPSTFSSSALTGPPPGSYVDATSSNDTNSAGRDELPWAGTSQWNEEIHFQHWDAMPPSLPKFSTTETETTTAPPLGIYSRGGDQQDPPTTSSGWSSPYLSWLLDNERRMPPTSNQFDEFNMDEETFGGYTTNVYGDHGGYTPAPQRPNYPFPLPDAPPTIRQHGQYHGPRTSRLYAGTNDGAGGSNDNPPTDPPQPSNEECLLQAKKLLAIKDRQLTKLRLKLAEQEAERDAHAELHRLSEKGKQPDRPPPPRPKLATTPQQTNRLVWQAPNPYPAPVGEAPDEVPWLGVKPLMVKAPLPFEGKYDDVDRFIGDFSHLEGTAKDWWVHAHQDFWYHNPDDAEPERFRFPSWREFISLLSTQFHDTASEEVHEKRMFDLRMGKGPALAYFQELEMEAKKANQCGDDQARGLMVKAV